MPVIVHPPAVPVKPAPETNTVVPADPEFVERTTLALTLKRVPAGVGTSSCGVPVTNTVLSPFRDPSPTLNLAVNWPVAGLTVHGGSPVVSMIRSADDVRVHPVSRGLNPVPETVTSVADAPGVPLTAGDPDVGLRVTAALTVNGSEAKSPWSPVTVKV
jgi:hypothetical protein